MHKVQLNVLTQRTHLQPNLPADSDMHIRMNKGRISFVFVHCAVLLQYIINKSII